MLDSHTNPFFDFYTDTSEQDLYQDIVAEAMQMYGHNILYIPRNLINTDYLYNTDDQSSYSTVIPTVAYVESIDGFQGQSNIFSKFGLEIRDQITLSIASRTYDRTIKPVTGQPRPMEGDLIYFTVNKKVFQIKYTNNKEIFYFLGTLPSYKLNLELFEYSDETFNTGIPDIDSIQNKASMNIFDNQTTNEAGLSLTDEVGNVLTEEAFDLQNIDPVVDNSALHGEAASLIDWSLMNPLGKITSDNTNA